MTTMTALATQVYQVFIKATPEAIWEAITNPEFTQKYFHGARIELAGGRRISRGPGGETWGDEAVMEEDPPRRLVHEWRAQWDSDLADEPASRVTWEIEQQDGNVSLLTVVHDQLEASPKTATSVAGGWMRVLSGLKTVLETGEPLA
jgi:uncharacterized protein YndB with AHSA1/START domain